MHFNSEGFNNCSFCGLGIIWKIFCWTPQNVYRYQWRGMIQWPAKLMTACLEKGDDNVQLATPSSALLHSSFNLIRSAWFLLVLGYALACSILVPKYGSVPDVEKVVPRSIVLAVKSARYLKRMWRILHAGFIEENVWHHHSASENEDSQVRYRELHILEYPTH